MGKLANNLSKVTKIYKYALHIREKVKGSSNIQGTLMEHAPTLKHISKKLAL